MVRLDLKILYVKKILYVVYRKYISNINMKFEGKRTEKVREANTDHKSRCRHIRPSRFSYASDKDSHLIVINRLRPLGKYDDSKYVCTQ